MASQYETRWILTATVLASGMAFLIGAAVSVALPTIQESLNASISGLQWIINSYTLTLAVLILIGGSLGDLLGRKRVFSYGIIIFVIGSFLSGLSQTIEGLISFQALQGVGAALMIPGSLAIINSCIPSHKRGRAIGQWAGFSGGIAALGPFLGGFLVETLNWQSVFFINLPIGFIALWITWKYVPESKNPHQKGIDWSGILFIALGLFGISYSLIKGPLDGWSDRQVLGGLIFGSITIVLFLVNEVYKDEPVVPLKIFRNPLVTGANVITLFLYFSLNGVIFFLVINFQQFQGYSPITTGLGLLPPFLIITLFSGPSGSLSDRTGPRMQMITGPIIVALGMILLAISDIGGSYWIRFMPGLVLFGSGMAFVIAPLTKSALSVEEGYSGVASGVNNSVARIAALLAIALMGAVVVTLFSSHLQASLETSALTKNQRNDILSQTERLGALEIPENFDVIAYASARNVVDESFMFGFRWAMLLGAFLALLSSIVAAITIR